jgi:hypothetical protein
MSEDELVGPGVEGGLGAAGVMGALLQNCPSLLEPFAAHVDAYGNEPRGAFNDAAIVAVHLVDLLAADRLGELKPVLAALEHALARANRDGRSVLIVGVLEGMQNVCLNRGRDPGDFCRYLGPETTAAWGRVERYWRISGARSIPDLIRIQQGREPINAAAIDPSKVSDPELRAIIETLQRPQHPLESRGPGSTRPPLRSRVSSRLRSLVHRTRR